MSKRLEGEADKLLASSGLLPLLHQYGHVEFVGSYPLGLMTCADIDMHISRKKAFTKAEVLKTQACIIAKTFFTGSGYYFSDWFSGWRKKNQNLPHGHYLGLAAVCRGQGWKIDLWFMSDAEQHRRRHERVDMRDVNLTITQKVTMMRFKRYLLTFPH